MNYSRNIKKASIGKRVLISWVVVAIIFSLVGFGIGAICSGNDSPEQPEHETQKEVLIFGQPDGRIFEGEMPGEWMNGERKFVPLNVPMDEDLQEFIFYLSQAYEMDFTFVMALIQQESSYKPDVISASNDYGLMQINEITRICRNSLELPILPNHTAMFGRECSYCGSCLKSMKPLKKC